MSLAFAQLIHFPLRTARALPISSRPRWCATTALESTRAAIAANKVMVFSTTYCPYCSAVKNLFHDLKVEHTVWELDTRRDGDNIKQILREETGQRTVPNVFVAGCHVGGCDDTMALHDAGKLLPLINEQ